MGQGGHRLAEAFAEVATFPALADSKARLGRLTSKDGASMADIATEVESDAALAIAVMRAANNGGGPRGRVTNVPDAVEALDRAGVGAAVDNLDTYDFFERGGSWEDLPERFRRHTLAVRHAAERVADLGGVAGRDELAVAALLHDVGRLVLGRLYAGYRDLLGDRDATPEQRMAVERRELGIDHALVGGVLARRWGLPGLIASAIERHHSDDGPQLALVIRLSDSIAHHSHGDAIDPKVVERTAEACGLSDDRVRGILREFPYSHVQRQRPTEPCPLSAREVDALRGLASGKVYKEIAGEMGLSASTVRTHLHNVYRKIGAADRAQAVLIARERGWI
jgi:putative nucleotidyltransferase with HDIG domain